MLAQSVPSVLSPEAAVFLAVLGTLWVLMAAANQAIDLYRKVVPQRDHGTEAKILQTRKEVENLRLHVDRRVGATWRRVSEHEQKIDTRFERVMEQIGSMRDKLSEVATLLTQFLKGEKKP